MRAPAKAHDMGYLALLQGGEGGVADAIRVPGAHCANGSADDDDYALNEEVEATAAAAAHPVLRIGERRLRACSARATLHFESFRSNNRSGGASRSSALSAWLQ